MNLLTIGQLAGMWNVSKDTIMRHIKAGRLPATNFGTKTRAEYRIAPSDAEAFLNRNKVNAVKYSAPRRKKPDIPNYLDD